MDMLWFGYYEGTDLKYEGTGIGISNTTDYKKGLVIKIDTNGNYVWSKDITIADKDVEAKSVNALANGNIIVGANYTDGAQIIEYSSNGNIQNISNISDVVDITDFELGSSEDVIAVAKTKANTTTGAIYNYSSGTVTKTIDLDFNATTISKLKSGSYLIAGNYTGTSQSLTSKGNYDGIIVTYDGTLVSNPVQIGGTDDDVIYDITGTEDGGYLLGGYTMGSIDLDGDATNDITSISGDTDGFIVKFSSSNSKEWFRQASGEGMDEVTSVVEREEGHYVAGGYFSSSTLSSNQERTNAGLTLTGYTDGLLLHYSETETTDFIKKDEDTGEAIKGTEFTLQNEQGEYLISTSPITFSNTGTPYTYTTNRSGVITIPELPNGTYIMQESKSSSGYRKNRYPYVIQVLNGQVTVYKGDEIVYLTQKAAGREQYVLTQNLTDSDKTDEYQRNYQQVSQDGYLLKKSAEWTDIENGKVKIKLTVKAPELPEPPDTPYAKKGRVVYAFTTCTAHGLGYDTAKKNIQLLLENYETVDIIIADGKSINDLKYIYDVGKLGNTEEEAAVASLQGITFECNQHWGVNLYTGLDTYFKSGNNPNVVYTSFDLLVSTADGDRYTDESTWNKLKQYESQGKYFSLTGKYRLDSNTSALGWKTIAGLVSPGSWNGFNGNVDMNSLSEIPFVYGRDFEVLGLELTGENRASQMLPKIMSSTLTDTLSNRLNILSVTTPENASYTVNNDKIIFDLTNLAVGEETTFEINAELNSLINKDDWFDTNVDVAEFKEVRRIVGYKNTKNITVNSPKLAPLKTTFNATHTPEKDGDAYIITNKKAAEYTFKLLKQDRADNSPLQGVEFTLQGFSDAGNAVNKTIATNENGIAEFTGIKEGDYTLAETKPKDGYDIAINNLKVTVTSDGVQIFGLEEKDNETGAYIVKDSRKQSFFVKKVNNANGSVLQGAKFNLYGHALSGELVDLTVTSDANGLAEFEVEDGVYDLEELSAPTGYSLGEVTKWKVEIAGGQFKVDGNSLETNVFTVENVSKAGSFTVTKVWDGEIPVDIEPEIIVQGYDSQGNTKYVNSTDNAPDRWVKRGNAWEYTFDVKDTSLTYKAWEEYISEYNTSNSDENPLEISLNGANIITNYKIDTRKELTINKYSEDGQTSLEGAKFAIGDTNLTTSKIAVASEVVCNGNYYFEKQGNTYVPNTAAYSNQANSYIKIDTTNSSEAITVTLNATKSGSGSTAWATIEETTTAPEYSTTTGRFMYVTGVTTDTDYTTTLQPGKVYYLHLGYLITSTSGVSTTYTINSINIEGKAIVETTNKDGQIKAYLEPGNYKVIEMQPPTGHILPDNPVTEVTIDDEDVKINLTNEKLEKLTINKYSDDGETPLEGAKFVVDVPTENLNKIAGVGELTNNGTYYFEKQGNNLVPNTKASYNQANSYIKIDLSHSEVDSQVTINASKSGTGSYAYATITNTDTAPEYSNTTGRFMYVTGATTPETDYTTMLTAGGVYYLHLGYYNSSPSGASVTYEINNITVENATTIYTTNENGKIELDIRKGEHTVTEIKPPQGYLLPAEATKQVTVTNEGATVNFINESKFKKLTINKYKEDGETPLKDAKFLINKDENKLVSVGDLTNNGAYYFETTEDGKYVSNNQGKSATANSYIKIDTSRAKESVTVTVNAEISSENNYDWGYATITENTTAPAYNTNNTSNVRFIYISGTKIAQDYTTILQPRKVYYLHLGYRKDGSGNSGTDTFTINSITIEGAGKEYTSNEDGKIEALLEQGEYKVTEIEAPEGYVLPENPTTTVTVGKNGAEINLTNQKAITTGNVIVHHYIQGTTTSVPLKTGGRAEDETIVKDLGETYTTSAKTNIADEYELVEVPPNATGEVTLEDKIVTYYYKLKDPEIVSNITKTSTLAKLTNSETKVPYTINYTATVNKYKGNATVTIIDNLPYEIEIATSVLDGGTYDNTNKTLTWTENIENIDTFTNGGKEITITKNIELKYKNIDESQDNLSNTVTGKLNLATPEKEDTKTTTKQIPAEYLVNLTVNKNWEDNTTQAERRPSSIKLQVKNGNTVVKEHTLNTATETSYKFTELPKYNSSHQLINYTVDEVEATSGGLKFYSKSLGNVTGTDEKTATITNTFTKPNDKISLKVNKTWVDTAAQSSRRPSKIKFIVKNGENVVQEYSLNVGSETSHTFTNLDKYNDNGQEISYTVDELEVNTNDLQFYTKGIGNVTGGDSKSATITNTFTLPEDKINITVNKTWVDTSSQQDKRPSSVKLQVKNGNTVVQEYPLNVANETSHTFTNLAKYNSNGQEISYTVDEAEVNDGDLKFYTKSIGSLTGTNNKTATITNTFKTSDEKISKKVTKTWDDGERGRLSSIILVLTGNGNEYTHTLTASSANATNSNIWEYTFNNLPKYNANGNEIEYVLSERANGTDNLNKYIQKVEGLNVTNKLIIKDSGVIKSGTNTMNSLDETLNYTISYMAELDKEYTENVTITLTDSLPYKIDTSKEYNLNGGKYDDTAKTITWKAEYNPTTNKVTWKKWQNNSWVNDAEETLPAQTTTNKVNLSKEISLTYKEMEKSEALDNFTNSVKGKIELANGASEEAEDTQTTELNLKENVEINKTWIDGRKAHTTGELLSLLKLYKSIEGKEPQEVTTDYEANLNVTDIEDEETSKEDKYKAIWSNLPQYERIDTNNNGTPDTWKKITYYVQETAPSRYNSKYQNVENEETDKAYNNGTIINTINFALNISKQIQGESAQIDEYFTFTLTLKNEDNTNYTEEINTPANITDWTKTSDGVYSFKLKHGETLILNLPIGTKYQVKENSNQFYETNIKITKVADETEIASINSRETGERILNEGHNVKYTNIKESSPLTGLFVNLKPFIVIILSVIGTIGVIKFVKKHVKVT